MDEDKKRITGLCYVNKAFEFDVVNGGQGIKQDLSDKDYDQESQGAKLPSESSQKVKQIDYKTEANGSGYIGEVPDGGWGWIIAVGGFVAQTAANIFLACFGILYSEFLLDLGTSAFVSSWIYNVMGFTFTISGTFVRGLVEEFGFRVTSVIGTLLLFVGTTATAFANSAWFILVAYSLVAGTGIGIILLLSYAIVPYYFRKRLGIANGIMSSGVSAGQFVGPLFISYLRSEYGFQGAILLLGGFILQVFIVASVNHPIEWHLKVPREEAKKPTGKNIFKILWKLFINGFGNLKLLRSPVAVIIALGTAFNVIGYLNFLATVPFAMQENGFSVDDAAIGVTVSGFTNLFTRFVISSMTDASWFNMRYCYMSATFVAVVSSVIFCFLRDLTLITVLMGVWGCGVGAYMGLLNLVMVKYVGIQNTLAALGLSCIFMSFWFLACGPIIGAIRDASGSYTASICTLAGTMAITFVLYVFLPVAISYEEKRALKQKQPRGT